MLHMDDVVLAKQRVLIREDLNVPMKNGVIMDDSRIQRALPTIKKAVAAKACVSIMSHLGRPEEGSFDTEYSLAPIAKVLGELLGQAVRLVCLGDDVVVAPGEVVLYENVRFLTGEQSNDVALAKKMASCCDIFVMDAFATAHRAHASTSGVARYATIACAGPLLIEELNALKKVIDNPEQPLLAVVGGSKVSTKFHVLTSLLEKVSVLLVGGGIANTFLHAAGYNIGNSLYEPDWIDSAKQLLEAAASKAVRLPLPCDVIVADEFSETATATVRAIDDVVDTDMILDVGPKTAASYQQLLKGINTVIWNGPVGVFEFPAFSQGTRSLGIAIADSAAYSVAGGGDTLAALAKFDLNDRISYRSTGGGAFLELLEGNTLPVIAILEQRAQ